MIPIRLEPIRLSKSNVQVLETEEVLPEDWEELAKKIDFPDWEELKRIAKKGLLLGVDWETMDYVIIPWKQLTRHVALFGTTGSGKTFYMTSLLSTWILEKIAYPKLESRAIMIDNIGNFTYFGMVVWTKFYKEHYYHLGKPEELEEMAKNLVGHYAIKNPFKWQKRSFILISKNTITDFVSFLKHLGAEISEKAKQRIIQVLRQYAPNGYLSEEYDIELFIEELESEWTYEIQGVLDTLRTFIDEYGKDVFNPKDPSETVIILDGSRSSEKWIFHHSFVKYIYDKIKKEPHKYLGRLNYLLFIDEYNDILDDCELIKSKITRDKREGYYANEFRSFILRLWREGRSYGFSTWVSTQSPYQLLVREGRRLANIQTRIWGYLGSDIEKLARMERKDISMILDVLQQESVGNGWISKPRKGQFIIESENQELNGVMLKIFPPLFVQAQASDVKVNKDEGR